MVLTAEVVSMQQVKVGDTCSDWQGARRGVPQGNVLAPMFFVIYF